MIGPAPLCIYCKHLHSTYIPGRKNTCDAFPEGIPDTVEKISHVFHFDGDNGLIFEPKEEYKDYKSIKLQRDISLRAHKQMEEDRFNKQQDFVCKSEQPLEEWADELLPKEFVKTDFSYIISALVNTKHWIFSKLSKEQSEGVYQAMLKIMTKDRWSVREVSKKIAEDYPLLSSEEAERIARTETAHIVNVSRELDYKARDPEGSYRYAWKGPSDHRTTPICEAIKARVPKEGLPLNELKTIVTEEAQKYYVATGYDIEVRDWLPHINCRHHVRRVI